MWLRRGRAVALASVAAATVALVTAVWLAVSGAGSGGEPAGPWLITGAAGAGVGAAIVLAGYAVTSASRRSGLRHEPVLEKVADLEADVTPTQRTYRTANVPASALLDGPLFQVAYAQTGELIRTYSRESAALGFVRDVVRIRSREDAAQFELRVVHSGARITMVAQGEQLVRRALEDRIL